MLVYENGENASKIPWEFTSQFHALNLRMKTMYAVLINYEDHMVLREAHNGWVERFWDRMEETEEVKNTTKYLFPYCKSLKRYLDQTLIRRQLEKK